MKTVKNVNDLDVTIHRTKIESTTDIKLLKSL